MEDRILGRLVPALADVPGVAGIALGGSRARGTATDSSDYDLGLYYRSTAPLDTDRLLRVVRELVDDPDSAAVTPVGGWGRWIVGGGWLSVLGRKVDLLYRSTDAVAAVIGECRAGRVTMDYQPGHPHGFCSAIWMGEVALCQPLHDPLGVIAALKAMTEPYPAELRNALLRRFSGEILFSIKNGELAANRREQTHVAGCVYRALCCMGQVLFALNGRYLINEKGALDEAARFPCTVPNLSAQVGEIWQAVGRGEFGVAFKILGTLEADVRRVAATAEQDDF
jgi:hypothetical protein